MADDVVTASEIFDRLGEIFRGNVGAVGASIVVLSALNTALDAVATDMVAVLPAAIASLVVQYYVTTAALDRQGLREPGGGRFGSYFLLNLLSGLGIIIGLVLLILPGLYLSVRWSITSAILLAEGGKATDALGQSWTLTGRSFWAILGAYLVILVPAFVLGIGIALALEETLPLLASFVGYIFTLGAVAVSWLAGVAIYSLLRPNQDRLVEVFA